MCTVNQLIDNFLTFFVINQIEGVSVKQNVIEWNVVGHFVDGSDVGCIVVCVCFYENV